MQVSGKKSIREQMRSRRKELDAVAIQSASSLIVERMLALSTVRQAHSILLYLPIQGEVDTWPLCHHFWRQNVRVLLPRCQDNSPGIMEIYHVASASQLGPGKYGITEPLPQLARHIAAPTPDILLIPALAFDEYGFRLGYGVGYYDRFLTNPACTGLRIGLAYDFQIVPSLPADPWDIPVDLVLTPTRTITCKETS